MPIRHLDLSIEDHESISLSKYLEHWPGATRIDFALSFIGKLGFTTDQKSDQEMASLVALAIAQEPCGLDGVTQVRMI